MYFVYLLASKKNGTLYIGLTNNLARRAAEHRSGQIPGFTARYSVHDLVWYETFERIDEASAREKQLKGWNRAWKIKLIEETNPQWREIADTIPYT